MNDWLKTWRLWRLQRAGLKTNHSHLGLEPLERRWLLSAAPGAESGLGAGEVVGPLVFQTPSTGSNWTLRRNFVDQTDILEIFDNDENEPVVMQPLADVSGVQIFGGPGDDVLTIDYNFGGFFNPPDGIFFDGGAQGADQLRAVGLGSDLDEIEHRLNNIDSGQILADDQEVINYVGVESIEDLITDVDQRSFYFLGRAQGADVRLLDDNDAITGLVRIDDGDAGLFPSVTLANPNLLLMLQTGDGNDQITLIGDFDPDFDADIAIDAAGGFDSLTGFVQNEGPTHLVLTGDLITDGETTIVTTGVEQRSVHGDSATDTVTAVVVNTNDSGFGSLREAIQTSNLSTGLSLFNIAFDISNSPGGPPTIAPSFDLPALGNPGFGVFIDGLTQGVGQTSGFSASESSGNLVAPGVIIDGANLEEGDGDGLVIGSSHNQIAGLSIQNFANHGVVVRGGVNNTILNNEIAFNGRNGVNISDGTASIRFNSIHNNAKLGINLEDDEPIDSPTPNDVGDSDNGPNGLQNFPELISAQLGSLTINGRLDSRPNTLYEIDFYLNDALDASGFGEGRTYIGSTQVSTDGAGAGLFGVLFDVSATSGQVVTAVATDPLGATSEFSAGLLIDDQPAEPIVNEIVAPQSADEGASVNFQADVSYDGEETLRYIWNFGDGSDPVTIVDDNTVAHTYADDGEFEVNVTVELVGELEPFAAVTTGESNSASTTININNVDPTINSFAAPSFGEVGELLTTFTATAFDPGDDALLFTWDFGDNSQPALGRNASHTFNQAGVFTVTLTVTDDDGGESVQQQNINIDQPAPELTINGIIIPTGMLFEGQLIGFGANFTYSGDDELIFEWDFGDGSDPAFGQNVNHVFADNGEYDVTVHVINEDETASDSFSIDVTIKNANPTINSFNAPNSAQTDQNVNMSASASDPGAFDVLAFAWNFGDDAPTQNGANVSHAYNSPGQYVITLTVTDDDGGVDITTRQISIQDPEPDIELNITALNSPISGAEGQSLSYNAQVNYNGPGTLSFVWTFGDGSSTQNGANVNHVFSDDGPFTVTVIVDDGLGALDTQSVNVNVGNVAPTVTSLNVPAQGLTGQSLAFASTAADPGDDALTHTWDFGDESGAAVGANVNHTYNQPGFYLVTLTVTDGDGGQDVVQANIDITDPTPDDNAGDDLANAFDLGFLRGRETAQDAVGSQDLDFYRFQLDQTADVTLKLIDLTADANLALLRLGRRGRRGRGTGKDVVIAESNNLGKSEETISMRLRRGVYFIKVNPADEATANHTLLATADTAGDAPRQSRKLRKLARQVVELREFAGADDGRDLFTVKIGRGRSFTHFFARIQPADGNEPMVRLLDRNGLVMRFAERVNGAYELVHALKRGVYFMEVTHQRQGDLFGAAQLSESEGEVSATGGNYDLTVFADRDKAGMGFADALRHRRLSRGRTSRINEIIGGVDLGDMHRITLRQGGTIVSRVFNLQGDLRMTVFDSMGDVIGDSDNQGASDESVTVDVAPGVIFIFVEGADADVSSTYTLQTSLFQSQVEL